jgi:hypothetical protein
MACEQQQHRRIYQARKSQDSTKFDLEFDLWMLIQCTSTPHPHCAIIASNGAHDQSRDLISARACRAQPDESKRAFPELVTGDHLSTPAPLHVLVHTQLAPTLRPHDPTTTASTRPAAPADNESRSDNSPPT